MNILIVDDDESKASTLAERLTAFSNAGNANTPTITKADALSDAIRILNTNAFDLIVLDLLIPYISGGAPSSQAGLELVQQLRTKIALNKYATVVGISAFPDEIASLRSTFDSLGVLILCFDDRGLWQAPLKRTLQDAIQRSGIVADLDFLVVCALDSERSAFKATNYKFVTDTVAQGLNVRYVRSGNDTFGAIIRLSRMGLVAATREVTIALSAFRTPIVCMSGICAGLSEQSQLGQLVVASPAWEYQAGKWSSDGFEIAPEQIPLRPATRTIVDHEMSLPEFAEYLEKGLATSVERPSTRPQPMLAPFATGSAVIADSSRLAHIEKQHRKVAALDMETFGLYYAAHESLSSVKHFFSVKCVVDLADQHKGDGLHQYGCIVAARATERIIEALSRSG